MAITLRPYQEGAIERARECVRNGKKRFIICAAVGCHALGQLIMMFDGSFRLVEHVQVGDFLMGPDSQPRRVLELKRGHGQMVRVVPVKGAPFVVNDEHMLTLVRNDGKWANTISDVTVREFLAWGPTWRATHKLFRVPVAFPSAENVSLPIDPYFLGVILGDGSIVRGRVSVSKPDQEIRDEVYAQATACGMSVRVCGQGSSSSLFIAHGQRGRSDIINPMLDRLRLLG